MIDDILTMAWKERKGMFRYRGSRGRFLLNMASVLILAVVFPLTEGPAYVEGAFPLIIAGLVPVLLVAITIPDSFAGERERHTLGTLLASRLPDRAILLGKLAVAVAFAWGLTLLLLLLSLVTVNIANWEGELLVFPSRTLLAAPSLSFLLATLASSAGVLISLRSETVQQATQTLVAVFLIPPMLLQLIPLLFMDQFREFIEKLDPTQTLLILIGAFAVIDVIVFAIVLSRFQRSKLYLD